MTRIEIDGIAVGDLVEVIDSSLIDLPTGSRHIVTGFTTDGRFKGEPSTALFLEGRGRASYAAKRFRMVARAIPALTASAMIPNVYEYGWWSWSGSEFGRPSIPDHEIVEVVYKSGQRYSSPVMNDKAWFGRMSDPIVGFRVEPIAAQQKAAKPAVTISSVQMKPGDLITVHGTIKEIGNHHIRVEFGGPRGLWVADVTLDQIASHTAAAPITLGDIVQRKATVPAAAQPTKVKVVGTVDQDWLILQHTPELSAPSACSDEPFVRRRADYERV